MIEMNVNMTDSDESINVKVILENEREKRDKNMQTRHYKTTKKKMRIVSQL